jgi:hypothetical protein
VSTEDNITRIMDKASKAYQMPDGVRQMHLAEMNLEMGALMVRNTERIVAGLHALNVTLATGNELLAGVEEKLRRIQSNTR